VYSKMSCSLASAGKFRDTRGGLGGWEREPRTGAEAKSSSASQGEESCGSGRGPYTLHTDSHHSATCNQLEAPTEARPATDMRRGCGYSATHTQDIQVQEVGRGSTRGCGLPGADAHAGDRGWKRSRTSTSRYDASTPASVPHPSSYSHPFCILELHCWFACVVILIAIVMCLCRDSADSRCKTHKGREGEGGAIEAETSACLGAPNSPA
jgi:hypothetical protein